MARFVAILAGKQPGLLTEALLLAHVRHLRTQAALGHLVLCGPFTDGDGAVQVLDAADRAAARTRGEADPFVRAGYYGRYVLHEFLDANEANDWLIGDAATRADAAGRICVHPPRTTGPPDARFACGLGPPPKKIPAVPASHDERLRESGVVARPGEGMRATGCILAGRRLRG